MNRRQFIGIAAGAVVAGGAVSYLLSDRSNLVRSDLQSIDTELLEPDEKEILFLASLAPSGHNTQPWFIQYLEPYHWIIGNDKTKWLPGVDPNQREIILSIGAFVQNLEYAAGAFGYSCDLMELAANNQDERILEVKLFKKG
jgi:nitroreductase